MTTPTNLPTTWADVGQFTIGQVAELPVDTLAGLADQVKVIEAHAKTCKAFLGAALQAKYGFDKNAIGTNRIHDNDGDIDVVVTVGKSVSWDQDKLASVAGSIKNDWLSDPDEYIDTKRSVSETKYNAWPSEVREMFEPARTVKPSSPKITFDRKAEVAA